MNAPDKLAVDFVTRLESLRTPLPASRKVYVPGSLADVRVPMREVSLTNGETVTLYDTSGPYTDPHGSIDIRRGLPDLRSAWIDARGDTERYAGRQHGAVDDGLRHADRDAQALAQLRQEAAGLQRQPRRAKAGGNVSQMYYARRGIITPEMEYVALRENGKREWMKE